MGIGNDMIIFNQYIVLLLRPQLTSTFSPFFRTFVTEDRNCFEKKPFYIFSCVSGNVVF